MAGFQIAFTAFLLIPMVFASNMCSFHYSVPKTGSSCEVFGGVDQDLENKVSGLTGSFEGLKVIKEANLALTKELQTTASYAQQSQQAATQQLDSLATDINSLKALLNVVYDEPVEDMGNVDDDGVDLRSNKANPADPNRLLRLALQEAEMKINNMTNFMIDNSRRQSVIRTSMEMRIQQQQMRLQRAMSELKILENQVRVLSGHPRIASPFFNTANQEYTDLVNISIQTSAAVAASTLVATARNDDINVMISNVLIPLKATDRELTQLHSDTLALTLRVDSFENETDDLDYEIKTLNTKWSANFLQILTKIPTFRQKLVSFKQQMLNFSVNISSISNTLSQEEADLNRIKIQIDAIAQNVTASLANINRTQQQAQNFENIPIVSLAEVQNNATAELQREATVINRLQQVISNIQSILKTIPAPKPTGNHPRRRSLTTWQRSVLCDA